MIQARQDLSQQLVLILFPISPLFITVTGPFTYISLRINTP